MSSKRKSQPSKIPDDSIDSVLKPDPIMASAKDDLLGRNLHEQMAHFEYLKAIAQQYGQLPYNELLLQQQRQNQKKSMEDILKKLAGAKSSASSPESSDDISVEDDKPVEAT